MFQLYILSCDISGLSVLLIKFKDYLLEDFLYQS